MEICFLSRRVLGSSESRWITGYTKIIKYHDKKYDAGWGIRKYDDKTYYARSHIMTVLSVSVFGPESVSYERSRRENRAKFHEISARVFFVRISKSQDSRIYCILVFFSRTRFPKWILPQMLCKYIHIRIHMHISIQRFLFKSGGSGHAWSFFGT